MAGIDKVCEFSGNTPNCPNYGGSWIMGTYSRNHIQIIPRYRKKFRGARARLRITDAEIRLVYPGRTLSRSPCVGTAVDYGETAADYVWNEQRNGMSFLIKYTYILEVDDEKLQGRVGGKYKEWSTEIGSVIRRLRRMVGPGLEVVREVPGRTEIFRNWRREFDAKCEAYRQRETARENAQG